MKLNDIVLLTEQEKNKILMDFNDTNEEIPSEFIHEIFMKMVEKYPDSIAAIYIDENITYSDLNKKSNRIARYLKDKGVNRNSLVGIFLDRSIDFLASILGIFKAGGAYVPIDINNPKKRIEYILSNSNLECLITSNNNINIIDSLKNDFSNLNIICLDRNSPENIENWNHIEKYQDNNLELINELRDIAYVIYTSGTTGTPKGVVVEHIGMSNHIKAKIKDLSIDKDDIIAQIASASFDISVWQFLTPIVTGGKVIIISDNDRLSPERILFLIRNYNISILETVPSFIKEFLFYTNSISEEKRNIDSLKWFISTGESLPLSLVKKWFNTYKNIKVLNAYGPTEASDDITHFIMEDIPGKILVGKPISNIQIYILDKNMNLCPINTKGEICVAGIGVGKGYLNDKEKTEKSFIKNPFHEYSNDPEKRLYKTGDYGRFLPDGNIEFLGRIDHQVKIRGFRIELEEIEFVLLEHNNIKDAVVNVHEEDNGNKKLIAYIVTTDELSDPDIIKFLKSKLTQYMMPDHIVRMESIPLTPAGKVKRSALRVYEIKESKKINYYMPKNNTEKMVYMIWKEVLLIDQIGTNDDFFYLGGNSIKAMQIVSKLLNKGYYLEVKDIFYKPTISELSKFILENNRTKKDSNYINYCSINEEKVDINIYQNKSSDNNNMYEPTIEQESMWLISSNSGDEDPFINTGCFKLEGVIEDDVLYESTRYLINRHDILRTIFKETESGLKQVIKNNVDNNSIKIMDISNNDVESIENIVKKEYKQLSAKKMDLYEGPLFQSLIIKISNNEAYWIIKAHHIIIDGVSINILIKEYTDIYQSLLENKTPDLQKLNFRYTDYAIWRKNKLKGEYLDKCRNYWKKTLYKPIPVTELPLNVDRSEKLYKSSNSVVFEVSGDDYLKLKSATKEKQVTLNIIFLTGLTILLNNITNQEDIIIGTLLTGHIEESFDNIIGNFVNLLPLRINMERINTVKELLNKVKEEYISSLEYGIYPFEYILKDVNPPRIPGQNPIFSVLLQYINRSTMYSNKDIAIEANNNIISKFEDKNKKKTTDYDLLFDIDNIEDRVIIECTHSTRLDKDTINNIMYKYSKIINTIVSNINCNLNELDILSKEEQKFLNSFYSDEN